MFNLIKKVIAVCAVPLILASGCAGKNTEVKIESVITDSMKQNSKKLDSVMRQLPVRGVVLPANGVRYYGSPDAAKILAERLASLGINRLYLEIERPGFWGSYDFESTANICRAAFSRKIACEAVLFQKDYMQNRKGSVLLRKFGEEKVLVSALRKIAERNRKNPLNASFSGVTIVPQIHTFTLASKELPSNAMYLWSENAYGKGRDNDLLMRQTFEELKECRKVIETTGAGKLNYLPLSVAVPAFYHDRAAKGDLSCGKITDFLAIAHQVIVIGEGSKPSEFGASFNAELKAASKYKERVIMGLNLAPHSVGTRNNLRRRDWADLAKITNYLIMRGGKYDAFGGMVFMPWHTLELLWEE